MAREIVRTTMAPPHYDMVHTQLPWPAETDYTNHTISFTLPIRVPEAGASLLTYVCVCVCGLSL